MKGKNKIFTAFALGLIFLLGVMLCGCDFGEDDSAGESGGNKIAVQGDVKLEVNFTSGLGYSVTVTGLLKNSTKKNYSYVSVTYTLYDAAGNNLGTALDNMNHLGAGETWRFTAKTIGWVDVKPVSCKCSDITAF